MPSTEHMHLDDRVRRLERQLDAALMQINNLTRTQQNTAEKIEALEAVIADHIETDPEIDRTINPPTKPTKAKAKRTT